MTRLTDLVPDVEALLAMPPGELAPFVLEAAKHRRQSQCIILGELFGDIFKSDQHGWNNPTAYTSGQKDEVELAIAEAWSWLEANQLVVPDPGPNGSYGGKLISRRGESLTPAEFTAVRAVAAFPKGLLHPLIREDVWSELLRGKYDKAVFTAFKAVEEQVREAGSFKATDIGVPLMRSAFNEDAGPLTRFDDPLPERQALCHLFAGAIGSYKNPHSHRTVVINEPSEAQEMVILASHLLRIVDARRSK